MQYRTSRVGRLACCGLLLVLVNACAMVGPPFALPEADVSASWTEADDARGKKDLPDCADWSLTLEDNLVRQPG